MAAVRLSRLPQRIRRWLAAEEQRTKGMGSRSPPELVSALPRAKGQISHSLRLLEHQGLSVIGHTPDGQAASLFLTAAGRQKARQFTGRDEEGIRARELMPGSEQNAL